MENKGKKKLVVPGGKRNYSNLNRIITFLF